MIRLARNLKLPIDFVTHAMAVISQRGGGKTYASMKLAEQLLDAKVQTDIFDPVGVWYGLRSNANGTGPGYPIPIFGGLHGDVELKGTPEEGAFYAQLIVDEDLSAIFDLSQLSKSKRTRFMEGVAEEFFQRRKADPAACHLIFEEAQVFCPERSVRQKGDERMLGAITEMVRLGRNHGIGVTLVSQRPQSVAKEALNQAECLLVGHINGKHERRAIEQWIDEAGADEATGYIRELKNLQTGEFYFWSPSWLQEFKRVRVSKRKTFDSSATPKPGKRRVEPRGLAPVEIERLSKRLDEIVQEQKANDPSALKQRIRELEATVARMESQPAPAAVLDPEILADVERAEKIVTRQIQELTSAQGQLHTAALKLRDVPRPSPAKGRRASTTSPGATPKPPVPRKASRASASNPSFPHQKKKARLMVAYLNARHPVPLTRGQLGLLCGIRSTGSTMSSYLSNLKTAGVIELFGPNISLTPSGREYAKTIRETVPETHGVDTVVALWRDKLKRGARQMLDHLHEHRGRSCTREELAAAAGGIAPTGSTVSSYLSNLRTAGLIEEDGSEIRLTTAF